MNELLPEKTPLRTIIWKAIAEKGKFASLIGFFFAAPVNGWALYKLYNGLIVNIDQLWVVVVINAISIVWFILPSKISIKWKSGEIIVED